VRYAATNVHRLTGFVIGLCVPRLRRSVAGLTTRTLGFDLKSVLVRFVVGTVALVEVFIQMLIFPLSVPFHHCSYVSPCQYHSTTDPMFSPVSTIPLLIFTHLYLNIDNIRTKSCRSLLRFRHGDALSLRHSGHQWTEVTRTLILRLSSASKVLRLSATLV
jgi:hypothetical protein